MMRTQISLSTLQVCFHHLAPASASGHLICPPYLWQSPPASVTASLRNVQMALRPFRQVPFPPHLPTHPWSSLSGCGHRKFLTSVLRQSWAPSKSRNTYLIILTQKHCSINMTHSSQKNEYLFPGRKDARKPMLRSLCGHGACV